MSEEKNVDGQKGFTPTEQLEKAVVTVQNVYQFLTGRVPTSTSVVELTGVLMTEITALKAKKEKLEFLLRGLSARKVDFQDENAMSNFGREAYNQIRRYFGQPLARVERSEGDFR